MLAWWGPSLHGKPVILTGKGQGLDAGLGPCPSMLTVTPITALALPGLYFPIWDDFNPDWSSSRVWCKDLWHHFPQVIWNSKENYHEKNKNIKTLNYWQRKKTSPVSSPMQGTTMANYNWKFWETLKWEAVSFYLLLYFSTKRKLQMEPIFSAQGIISSKTLLQNPSWSKDQGGRGSQQCN